MKKHIINTICGATIITGLVMAGAECANTTVQLFVGFGGACLFAAGCMGLCHYHREG